MTNFRERAFKVIRSRSGAPVETAAEAAARRRAEFAELTGRAVRPLSETEARRMVEAIAAVGPPAMPARATPSAAATASEIVAAGEVRRGERHNSKAPPQPQREKMTSSGIISATAKARGET
jgi:hypothetical protein